MDFANHVREILALTSQPAHYAQVRTISNQRYKDASFVPQFLVLTIVHAFHALQASMLKIMSAKNARVMLALTKLLVHYAQVRTTSKKR